VSSVVYREGPRSAVVSTSSSLRELFRQGIANARNVRVRPQREAGENDALASPPRSAPLPDVISLEPPVFPFRIARIGVLQDLTLAQDRPATKLLTVTAPIGYGKTVLLSALHEHFREHGGSCRWLALDDRDQTVDRVLTHLEGRFHPSDSRIDPFQALQQGDEPLDERLDRLVGRIAMARAPTTLFIDNLDACSDALLPRLLDALIFRTPPWIHVVLSSIGLIPFHQGRAKLEGRLRSLGLHDLCFDRAKIREVFGPALCARLSPSAIELVECQTEGWPCAIRLMQIVLSEAASPDEVLARFSGADEDLAELLNHLVQGFDAEFRRFLLRLSLLRSFDVDLAGEATDDSRAAAHIERLWRNNIFVIPLDRNRCNYRLHAMFREYLLAQARRELSAAARRDVLNRAAIWCERACRWDEAIDYALEADSLPLVVAILERRAPNIVRDRGNLGRYLQWLERLHATGERGGLETDYWYVWALVFHRQFETARREVTYLSERVQRETKRGAPAVNVRAIGRRVDVIRIALDVYTDFLDEGHHNAEAWLRDADPDDDPFSFSTVSCAAAIYAASTCKLADARRWVRLAQSSMAQLQSDYGAAWVAVVRGLVALREGEFADAHQDLLGSLAKVRATLGEHGDIYGITALLAAHSAVEIDQPAEAEALLAQGLLRARLSGIVDTMAHGLDAAVKLWRGQDDATLSLAALREIAASYPPRLSLMLSCFLVRRLLVLGRTEEAEVEAAHIGLLQWHDGVPRTRGERSRIYGLRDLAVAATIELLVATRKLKPASALMAEEIQRARAEGRSARLVELALDEAAISLYSYDRAPAAGHLARAISLAARPRCLRPFRDRAPLIAALVNDTRPKDWRFAIERERQFFVEVCRGVPTAGGALAEQLEELGGATGLSETPTARELELLTWIDAGLSNQQLADRLSISVATVKWHLHNLYAKLGVKSRAAALAVARSLHLLSP
jgi:LuxR family maltose regulon positive regulatory protein